MNMKTRREFLKAGACAAGAVVSGCVCGDGAGEICPAWRPGEFDIHFIHTGVGEQTFFIFPDGTTMLLDCGDTHHARYMKDVPPMPDHSRYGGEWTSRYIRRVIPGREIDYVMASHWHGDHVGDLMFGGRRTADGRMVCGIPLVGEDFRFRHYIDRRYPEMAEDSMDPDPQALSLMREWLPHACAGGMRAHRFEVGALNQIRLLKDPSAYGNFEVRNIAANASVTSEVNSRNPPEELPPASARGSASSAAGAATLAQREGLPSSHCEYGGGRSWSQDTHSSHRLWPLPSSAPAWLPKTTTVPHHHNCQSKRDWPNYLGLFLYHKF